MMRLDQKLGNWELILKLPIENEFVFNLGDKA